MRLQNGLDDVFATGTHIRVLRTLDALPAGVGASGREIARRTGVSAPAAREALESLVEQGLVRVERSLKRGSYRLDPEHVLSPLLAALFESERAVLPELRSAIAALVGKYRGVSAAYLFGSAARGDMKPGSDVDVAIRGTTDIDEDDRDLERIRRRFGNRVHVIRLRSDRGAGLRKRVRAEGKALPIARPRTVVSHAQMRPRRRRASSRGEGTSRESA